jgi:hypothetical protein
MRRLGVAPIVTGLLVSLAVAQSAHAGMTVSIYNDGSGNVVAMANGSINLTGLTYVESSGEPDVISPDVAGLISGDTAEFGIYTGLSGPTTWGPGGIVGATSGSGDIFGIVGVEEALALPDGYISGSTITSSAVFSSNTIDGLGLTPGAYTYNWGSGSDADSIIVNISEAASSSAPEPSTGLLGIVGIGALITVFRSGRGTQDSQVKAAI